MIGTICAGFLALVLQAQEPNPFLVFTSTDTVSMWSTFCDDCIIELPDPHYVAVFGHKTNNSNPFDVDYRCGLIVSRDGKNGWLIDRKENTAVRIEGQDLPEWCTE